MLRWHHCQIPDGAACWAKLGTPIYRLAVSSAHANREIAVPGLETDSQPRAHACWRRDRGPGKQAGEIYYVQSVSEIVALDFEGDVLAFFVEQRGARGYVKRKIRAYAARVEIHFAQNGGAILLQQESDLAWIDRTIQVHGQPASIFRGGGEPQ